MERLIMMGACTCVALAGIILGGVVDANHKYGWPQRVLRAKTVSSFLIQSAHCPAVGAHGECIRSP